ncbi:hypothetical protein [Actinomadura rayongensis]|uniref:Uncharacterized protein n=1 Tax=Actinomadura rayongensis TaxID=1429076 RepID=A0A6I4W8T6_9ACTN|nr:hypothetical protein [Actinomadura rayongensis]MXQ66078.1 hypothetical protein [Actinomadura rayongensis]
MTDTVEASPVVPAPLCLTCFGAGLVITLGTPGTHRAPAVSRCPDCAADRTEPLHLADRV